MASPQSFDVAKLLAERGRIEEAYHEFLRVPSLSCGLYLLPAGGEDRQEPHTEDEIYYVLWGKATLRLGSEEQPLGPGTVAYVPAGLEHRFHDIEEALGLLVVFAPAEGTAGGVTAG